MRLKDAASSSFDCFHIDLKKGDKADAIQAIQDVLSQLEGGADAEPSK